MPLALASNNAGDGGDDEEDLRPHGLSDDLLAIRFTSAHKAHMRYCAEHSAWYLYEDGAWRRDTTLHVFEMARKVCRAAQDDLLAFDHLKPAVRERLIRAMRSAQTIAAVERLARSDRAHAVTAAQFDAEDWLLNTPAGEVNLRTGETAPHDPDHYHTKRAAVAPGDALACPTWLSFLARVTHENAEMIDYLQAVAGYALSGVVTEHVLLFLWGSGANGKSTFVNTLTGILGDYAAVAPMEVFVEQAGHAHPTELAMLAGARLVAATETDPGRRWAAARIKALTGGDPVTARFMRADFFTYRPRFLLLLSGNHRPHLGAIDEGIRRRLHLVPFDTHIPAAERDPGLPEKLRAEWPAILAWMVQGCLRWQREGLKAPAVVTGATEDYMEGEDTLGLWLDAATAPDPNAFEPSARLYADYADWCAQSGERAMTQKHLTSALQDRGLRKCRTKAAKGFEGRKFKPLNDRPWVRTGPLC